MEGVEERERERKGGKNGYHFKIVPMKYMKSIVYFNKKLKKKHCS